MNLFFLRQQSVREAEQMRDGGLRIGAQQREHLEGLRAPVGRRWLEQEGLQRDGNLPRVALHKGIPRWRPVMYLLDEKLAPACLHFAER
ncbi:MAG TPA: hypothetical protein VI454_03825 [Verrucomicrobiae bacterium]